MTLTMMTQIRALHLDNEEERDPEIVAVVKGSPCMCITCAVALRVFTNTLILYTFTLETSPDNCQELRTLSTSYNNLLLPLHLQCHQPEVKIKPRIYLISTVNTLTVSQAIGSPKNWLAWTCTLPDMQRDTDHLQNSF